MYTCTASSESGETSWSASLSVEDPKNPNIMFHKTPDPATFPQPPTKPKIVDRRSTSVTMSWRRNSNTGQSPLIGYTVEYFSSDLETGWVTAAHRITRYLCSFYQKFVGSIYFTFLMFTFGKFTILFSVKHTP